MDRTLKIKYGINSMEQTEEKYPILFKNEFVFYLTHKPNNLSIDKAQVYIKWLNDVNVCFGFDIVSDVYNVSPNVYIDLMVFISGKLSTQESKNCKKALKTYSQFIENKIYAGEYYPDQSVSYTEGALTLVEVNRFERNKKAREDCISHHGESCKACGISFAETYGSLGSGFIHVHHIVPLSKIRRGYVVDPVNDLVPVCPNCHAMLHRKTPPLTIAELKQLLGKT
ncbi:HNH endonuclease [Vibrio fluvialis]|nr:HNH endonuclease [Vibrio fluvialis]